MSFIGKAIKSVVKAVGKVVGSVVKVVGGVFGFAIGGKAKKTKGTNNLNKSLDPEAFRKIIFGKIAAPLDLRYWEVYGTNGQYYDEIIVVATHRIEAYHELYMEEKLAIADGSNSGSGEFTGVLSRTTRTGAVGQTAITAGGGTQYASGATFDGCPYFKLTWVPDEKKLPNGIPSRYTSIVDGALVYDPRRDTTVGGSGSHRANDRTTWQYSPVDANGVPIGRNNALQVLWYLLGWTIPTKDAGGTVTGEMLVAGRGIDPQDINMASFIAAANACEVAGYYTDLVLSTEDSHTSNEDKITCSGLIGRLVDPGGLWSYYANVNDTASIAVSLTDDDIIEGGTVTWEEYKGMSEQFNQVRGKFIYPASPVLYQPFPYPMVRDATYETNLGVKRAIPLDFEQVCDSTLAQRLARLKLNEGQYQGEFGASFNYKALHAQAWSVVQYTSERFGWTKLFRVWRQGISTDAGVSMLLKEIHSSIWSAGTVNSPLAPGLGLNYDANQEIPVAGNSLSANTFTAPDGTKGDGFRLTWTQPSLAVRRTEIRYKLTGTTYWTTLAPVERDVIGLVIGPLLSGAYYDIDVRHISVNEVPGPWTSYTNQANGTQGNVNYAAITAAGGTAVWTSITSRPANLVALAGSEGIVTAANIAAGIAGQGALATLNNVVIGASTFKDSAGNTVSLDTLVDNAIDLSNFKTGISTVGTLDTTRPTDNAPYSTLVSEIGPSGQSETIWKSTHDGNVAAAYQGGMWFRTPVANGFSPLDSYLCAVWVKNDYVTNTSGIIYFGPQSGSPALVKTLAGVDDGNPYFYSGGYLPDKNKWYLLIGIVHSKDYAGGDSGLSGIYDPVSGLKVASCTEFKWRDANVPYGGWRAFQYFGEPTKSLRFTRPRFINLTKFDPLSIQQLMATVGGTYGTNVFETGSTLATLANFKTALGTAAAIAGQGALATLNSADFSTQVGGVTKPEAYATGGDNLVKNSALASGTTSWGAISNLTRVVAAAGDPGNYWWANGVNGSAYANDTNSLIAPLPSTAQQFFVSGYIYGANANSYYQVVIQFYDTASNFISGVGVNLIAGTANVWGLKKGTIAVPNKAAFYICYIQSQINSGTYVALANLRIAPTEAAATLGGTLGTDLRAPSGTVYTQAQLETALGTAAAIAGQGTGATANNLTQLNSTEGGKLTNIDAGAGYGDNFIRNAALLNDTSQHSAISGLQRLSASPGDPANYWSQTGAGAGSVNFNNGAIQPVVGGTKLFPSAWVYGNNANSYLQLYVYFYRNNGGTFVSSVGANLQPGVVNTWTLCKGAAITVPIGVDSMLMFAQTQPNGGTYVAFANSRLAPTELQATTGGTVGTDVKAPGGTIYTQAQLETSLGTAAAITGQAATATSSNFSAVTGATKPENNADVTSTHTASAISGQGALATLNQADTARLSNLAATASSIVYSNAGAAGYTTGYLTGSDLSVTTGPNTGQKVLIKGTVGLRRNAGSNQTTTVYCYRTSDNTLMTGSYVIETTNDQATFPFNFVDTSPPVSGTPTYQLYVSGGSIQVREIFVEAVANRTG